MRIAVIGGGSAGLVTAWLLDGAHEVTVFEKAPTLGGCVKTLNRNVPCDLEPGLVLDAGVIEFETRNFPTMLRLFDTLGCTTAKVPGTSTFWEADGHHHLSPGAMNQAHPPLPKRIAELVDLVGLRLQKRRFERRTAKPEAELELRTLGDLLTDADMDRWAALLTTYAYSIPYDRVREVPAALAIGMLRRFELAEGWVSLAGGAWDYLQRIVDRFGGTVHTGAVVDAVRRDDAGVALEVGGTVQRFDKVVFAAPPDQTLALLADPSEAERRRFSAWRANRIHTLVHTDTTLYTRRRVTVRTEFDVIEIDAERGGYNAYLNRLCCVPDGDSRSFGLAFGIDGWIDPATVIHRQEHHTPDYTVEAYRWRHEVSATNGENHTFHAGAWLYDGLQEGAVTSALAVSHRLGGRSI